MTFDSLFDSDPQARLEASVSLATSARPMTPSEVDSIPGSLKATATIIRDLGHIFAPINSWMLFVGPSYIEFEEDQLVSQMGSLFAELVALDILEVRAKS